MKRPLYALSVFLIFKTAATVWFIHTGTIGLGPDEAQYWTWSQELSWGYYSKPPGIAWQIKLGTLLFGDTELGVRIIAVIIGFILPFAVYCLARVCRTTHETAFWSGTAMAFSPLGLISSILATTDGGMVLFWTLGCIVAAKGLARGMAPNYYLLGLFILCGALFKWPIYLLWGLIMAAMLPYPVLRSRHFFGGVALSLLGLLPSLYWNYFHDWATFKHVLTTIQGGHASSPGTGPLWNGNFLDFLGAQAALLSPIYFGLLFIAWGTLLRRPTHIWPSLVFCGGASLIIVAGYTGASFFQKIQGNWCVFAYPTGIVFMCWYACERVSRGKAWLRAGTTLSVILSFAVLSIPYLQENDIAAIPYRYNPFRHNMGWKRLGVELTAAGYNPGQHFLFSDKYQTTSILSFYAPAQKRAYFLNLQGIRKNQFSYWPGMAAQEKGNTGFFALIENEPHLSRLDPEAYIKELTPYFEEIKGLGTYPLFIVEKKTVKGMALFKCLNYNGKEPIKTELY